VTYVQNDVIKFIRRHDYQLLKELGKGACGSTVLLFDDLINEQFVCKKFTPYSEHDRRELFEKFVRETKILHQLNHENVVRIFNYYLYPDSLTGYILMEYVEGDHIDDFLASSPELINELFLQAIDAFSYLEQKGILHRDIRPQNLMVTNTGTLKVIDFGFGKRIQQSDDFDKSVTLNWWCEPPAEFSTETYDFKTEVYFVGKLFENIIKDNDLDQFKYTELLGKMCQRNPIKRIESFVAVQQHVQADPFLK
jgi:eukaryotic-like serine/threonine-protein kinase